LFLGQATAQQFEDIFSRFNRLLYKINEYIERRNTSSTERIGDDGVKSEDADSTQLIVDEAVTSTQRQRQQLLADGCRQFARVVNRSLSLNYVTVPTT